LPDPNDFVKNVVIDDNDVNDNLSSTESDLELDRDLILDEENSRPSKVAAQFIHLSLLSDGIVD
jgi:hypothetical protein